MKLKSLFLTSMVALALGACSNATEEATTNDASAKGTMIFKFGVNNTSSRAGEESGKTNVGTQAESQLNTVDVRVVAANGTVITNKFASTDFYPTSYSTDGYYTLRTPFEVPAGTATIFVSVNESNTAENSVDLATSYTSLDALKATGSIADVTASNFKMTGSNKVKVIAGETVNGTVTVDRVTAKLEERTSKDAFTVTTPVNLGKDQTSTPIKVRFTNYTYVNLTQQYNNFASTTFPTFTYLQSCGIADKQNDFNMDDATGSNLIGANAKAITGEIVANAENYYDNKTYCLENVANAANTSTSKETSIVYKAQIQFANADGTYSDCTSDCYVVTKNRKATFYKSFKEMDDDNNNIYSRAYGFNGTQNYAAFAAKGVQKYVKGVCYYTHAIQTVSPAPAVDKIVRNNWYILSVNSVRQLGTPVPNPVDPTTGTLLDLNILINPWTYQLNSFNL